MAFDFNQLSAGCVVHNKAGGRLTFVCLVPKAKPEQRLVFLKDGDIETYSLDGQYMPDKPSNMDLMPNS